MSSEACHQLGPLLVRSGARSEVAHEIAAAVARRDPMCVAFANTHLLYCARRDPGLARKLRGFQIFNDGLGADILLQVSEGERFLENLNGTDLTPEILARCPHGARVFLIGGKPHVARAAAAEVRRTWPHLVVCGFRDGYGDAAESRRHIEAAAPDLVLVAMGNPLQEHFIANCRRHVDAVFIGVGALFDFLAGEVRRAPPAWRRLRLEWLYRLTQEPSRMWRRYAVEPLLLLLDVYRERMRTGL